MIEGVEQPRHGGDLRALAQSRAYVSDEQRRRAAKDQAKCIVYFLTGPKYNGVQNYGLQKAPPDGPEDGMPSLGEGLDDDPCQMRFELPFQREPLPLALSGQK